MASPRAPNSTFCPRVHTVALPLLVLVLVLVLAPAALAAGRGLQQAGASAGARSTSFNFGFGLFNFGVSSSEATANAGAGAGGAGAGASAGASAGSGEGYGGGGSQAGSRARASSFVANRYAPRFGLNQGGARCLADAFSSAGSVGGGGGGSGASASGSSFAVGGPGLNYLANCGAQASATSSTLKCKTYTTPYNANICDFAGLFGTNCKGIRLINPDVSRVRAGQTIQVPPCEA